MKSLIYAAFASTLMLAPVPLVAGSGNADSKARVSVNFHEPENFTDFRSSEMGTDNERASLEKELTDRIVRSAAHSLPPDFTLTITFTNIELAGDINPYHNINSRDVRFYKSVYPPRLQFHYSVTDASGNVVTSGEETLTDLAYDLNIQPIDSDYVRIEAGMMSDFIRSLGRKIAQGTA